MCQIKYGGNEVGASRRAIGAAERDTLIPYFSIVVSNLPFQGSRDDVIGPADQFFGLESFSIGLLVGNDHRFARRNEVGSGTPVGGVGFATEGSNFNSIGSCGSEVVEGKRILGDNSVNAVQVDNPAILGICFVAVSPSNRGSGGGDDEPDLSKVPFDINKAALGATKGIDGGPSDVFTAYKDSLKEQTDTTNDLIEAFKTLNKAEGVDTNKQKPEPQGEYKSFSNEMANITQGVSGIVSGIEQLGIEIPQGLKSLLGGIQAVAGILTGISALVTIITAIQGTKAVPVIGWMLSHGGVVPHAANGYYVPGTHASGDVTPIMANAGELVLNKSSQGNLANDLKGAEALVQTIDRYQESIMRGSQMGNAASYMPGNNAAASGTAKSCAVFVLL